MTVLINFSSFTLISAVSFNRGFSIREQCRQWSSSTDMKPLVQLAAVTPRDVSLGTWLKLLFKQMNKCCFTLKEIHAGVKIKKKVL